MEAQQKTNSLAPVLGGWGGVRGQGAGRQRPKLFFGRS